MASDDDGRDGERGVALVVVLWVSLLLAAVAGGFILDTQTTARVVRNFVDNSTARHFADGGVHRAVFSLLTADKSDPWVRDGRRYTIADANGILEIAVEEERGKLDLNKAPLFLLVQLMRAAGAPPDVARGIGDAIKTLRQRADPSRTRTRPGPSARRSRSGRRVAFLAVDALRQIDGVSDALFKTLRPALTVRGDDYGLHMMTAPRLALMALPEVSEDAVDAFLEARGGPNPIAAMNTFLGNGRARDHLLQRESSFVTVKVLARMPNGARFARIALIQLRRSGRAPFSVHEWREGDDEMFRPEPPPKADGEGGV